MNKKKILLIVGTMLPILILATLWVFLQPDNPQQHPTTQSNGNNFAIVRQGTASSIAQQRKITIGADGVSGNILPAQAVTEADRLASQIVYEPLAIIGNNGALTGLLATSFSVSEAGHTYTFHIKDDAYFSDGSKLTPYDIERSFLALSAPGVETEFSPYLSRIYGWAEFRQGIANNIEGIFADPQAGTVTFSFATAGRTNERVFLAPVFKGEYGTGPFTLESVTGENIVLAANHNYHGDAPLLDYVFIRSANLTSAPMLLKQGSIDLFWHDYNSALLHQLLPAENISIGMYGGTQVGYIGFNQHNSLLQNTNILQALSLGLDVNEITQQHYGEFTLQNNASIVPPYLWLHPQNRDNTQMYNTSEAIAMLEAEGFALNEYGVFEKDGEELSFVINAINTYQALGICEAVADSWRHIGVRANVQTLSFSNLRDTIRNGDFDMLYLNMNIPHDMDFSVISGNDILLNPIGWQDQIATELAGQINNSDKIAAKYAFEQWLQNYEDSNVHLHIDRPVCLVFFNPNVSGLAPYNFGRFTWNIEKWSME